jgi:Domain of unknown function (DUF4412)
MEDEMKLFVPALAAALILPALGAASPDAFSCDMVVEGAIAGHTAVSKLYVSGPKVRLESERTITILRKDRGLAWVLYKQRKTYVEMPAVNPAVDPTRDPLAGASKQVLGKEMMNGYLCTKMRVTKNDPKLGSINAIVWMADKIGMAVRTETTIRGNRIVEYRKNIQMSEPIESLFEVPAGYTKPGMP